MPNTKEELEDLGEKADKENLAKKFMDSVRLRKVNLHANFTYTLFDIVLGSILGEKDRRTR